MIDLLLFLVEVQLFITGIAVVVDLGVVFRGFWLPLVRETAPEDRPYLFKGIARYAHAAHVEADAPRDADELNDYVTWRRSRAAGG